MPLIINAHPFPVHCSFLNKKLAHSQGGQPWAFTDPFIPNGRWTAQSVNTHNYKKVVPHLITHIMYAILTLLIIWNQTLSG